MSLRHRRATGKLTCSKFRCLLHSFLNSANSPISPVTVNLIDNGLQCNVLAIAIALCTCDPTACLKGTGQRRDPPPLQATEFLTPPRLDTICPFHPSLRRPFLLSIHLDAPPCPSFPWCFCFLGVFLAATFLGLFECFLLSSQGFKGSDGKQNPWCFRSFPWYFRRDQGKEGQGKVNPAESAFGGSLNSFRGSILTSPVCSSVGFALPPRLASNSGFLEKTGSDSKVITIRTYWITPHHFIFQELFRVIISPPITPNKFWGFNKRNSQEKLHHPVLSPLGQSAQSVTPKYSQVINWRHKFHLGHTGKFLGN